MICDTFRSSSSANPPYCRTDDTWRLIELAAEKSVNAYFESPELPPDSPVFELTPRGDSKRILGTVVDSVLVVAVRGSTSVMDWMVNGNGEPITPSQVERSSSMR